MSARDDYPALVDGRAAGSPVFDFQLRTALDEIDILRATVRDADTTMRELSAEIDRLRLLNDRLERDFADMNNARRNLDTGKVRSPVFCSATHPDTECAGWIWYCSLIAGHLGPHHCAGAAW